MGAAPATWRERAGLANGSAETSAERGTGSGEAPGGPDRFHPSRRPGERRKGRKRGAWPGRIRGGSTFSWECFGWMFQISVHIHTPPPAETAETVFRVNPIWPIPFHCLRHTTVSTPHENTPGPHIPAGFWKWVGPRRHVRGRKGSAWATSGGSVWIRKSTPLSPSKSRPENEPQGWPTSRLTSA